MKDLQALGPIIVGGLLLFVTIAYTLSTRKIAAATERAARASAGQLLLQTAPILSCIRWELDPDKPGVDIGTKGGEFPKLVTTWKNLVKGHAAQVRFSRNPDGSREGPSAPRDAPPDKELGQTYTLRLDVASSEFEWVLRVPDRFELVATYVDLFGNRYRSSMRLRPNHLLGPLKIRRQSLPLIEIEYDAATVMDEDEEWTGGLK
jgi:hypothetical protein